MIELAIVLPLMLMIIAGIIDFGFLFQRWEVLTNAAREGARVATLPGYDATDVQNRVQNYVAAGGVTSPVTVTVTDATETLASGATIDTRIVNVQSPYNFTILGPIVGLIGETGPAGFTMQAQSEMRLEASTGS